jgi:hypothetical protein
MHPFGIPIEDYSTEIIYSFVIILCSLMIYLGTKELYELSSHRGIGYLRKSFLFFAIAFFFRSFIKIFFIIADPTRIIRHSFILFQITSLFIFIYFSSIAIFYLIYSMMWKKWNHDKNKIYIFHLLALAIALISIMFNSVRIYLFINLLLLVFVLAVIYTSQKHKKKRKNSLYIIYVLLFVFWLLNVLDIHVPEIFETFQILIYMASTAIFMTILYKVLKKSGSN